MDDLYECPILDDLPMSHPTVDDIASCKAEKSRQYVPKLDDLYAVPSPDNPLAV